MQFAIAWSALRGSCQARSVALAETCSTEAACIDGSRVVTPAAVHSAGMLSIMHEVSQPSRYSAKVRAMRKEVKAPNTAPTNEMVRSDVLNNVDVASAKSCQMSVSSYTIPIILLHFYTMACILEHKYEDDPLTLSLSLKVARGNSPLVFGFRQ